MLVSIGGQNQVGTHSRGTGGQSLHLLHAHEVTRQPPALTSLYWAMWPEPKSSRTPSGWEAERYRITGKGWRSETVQERIQTLGMWAYR